MVENDSEHGAQSFVVKTRRAEEVVSKLLIILF
jgi:hypothetical protein